ncbi:MAG: ATP-binding cassette domain-containing protein [Rhodospirillales bacterium]|nr:ATP-binding cassette domain-containing protein [Rhodospirillales bacterium]
MTASSSRSILPLALKDVSFAIGGKRLIKNVSGAFAPGLCTVIIGPNGAGKSLLLRLCHGLLSPTSGAIVWEGANGRDPRLFQAMVFQRPVMLRRSVWANVDYALSLRGLPKAERRAMVHDALEWTGLSHLRESPARVLSGGEQQRLALARVWALNPEVLFLDEPTASLDPAATHTIEELIAAIHAAGTRLIMTTHDLGQARRMADEVIFMHRGRVHEQSPAEAFFAKPENELAQAFLRGELLWWDMGRERGEGARAGDGGSPDRLE